MALPNLKKVVEVKEGSLSIKDRQGLYEDMGKDYPGFTVPAINIRGLTYDVARAIFKKAIELKVGPFIFEIAKEKKEGQTEEQFIYSTRKKGFGVIKKKWWDLPAGVRGPIMKELEDKFGFLFEKLRVSDTAEIVARTVKPVITKKEIDPSLLG